MRNFSNKLSSHKSNICSALLLSCASILSAGSAHADNINIEVITGVAVESGVISGATSITKTGAGELELTATNTYTGSTIVTTGTLTLGVAATLPATAITLAASTTLKANYASAALITGNTVAVTGAVTIDTEANTFTIPTVISGTGSITKTDSGTLILSAANIYTGTTTVADGTLQIAGTASLPASQAITLQGDSIRVPGMVQF